MGGSRLNVWQVTAKEDQCNALLAVNITAKDALLTAHY